MPNPKDTTTALTDRQQRFLIALVGAKTVEEAVEKSGVGRRTAFTYLADPVFKAALRDTRADALGQAQTVLAARATAAAGVLCDLAESANTPAPVRATAARAVIELAARLGEGDVLERLETLEARLAELTPTPTAPGHNGVRLAVA